MATACPCLPPHELLPERRQTRPASKAWPRYVGIRPQIRQRGLPWNLSAGGHCFRALRVSISAGSAVSTAARSRPTRPPPAPIVVTALRPLSDCGRVVASSRAWGPAPPDRRDTPCSSRSRHLNSFGCSRIPAARHRKRRHSIASRLHNRKPLPARSAPLFSPPRGPAAASGRESPPAGESGKCDMGHQSLVVIYYASAWWMSCPPFSVRR